MTNLINKVRNIFNIIKASIIWVKAIEATAKNDYESARELLNQIIKTHAKDPEYCLLSGVVYFNAGAFSEALTTIYKANDLLENSKHYTSDEKNYLYCYADMLIGKIVKTSLGLKGDFSKLDKSKVREGIRLNFPM